MRYNKGKEDANSNLLTHQPIPFGETNSETREREKREERRERKEKRGEREKKESTKEEPREN